MSLRFKLLIPFAIFLICSVFFIELIWLPRFIRLEEKVLKQHEQEYIELFATTLLPDILIGDLAKIHSTLDIVLSKKEHFQNVILENSTGIQIYPIEPVEQIEMPDTSGSTDVLNYILRFQEKTIAQFHVRVNFDTIILERVSEIQVLEIIILLILVVATLFSTIFQELFIRRPLVRLAKASSKIAGGRFDVKLPPVSKDEIGQFNMAFDDMRKRIWVREGELASSKKRLAAIIENTIDSIITINPKGDIQSANRATESLFGYSQDEMLGKNINMLMPEPYHTLHDSYLDNYIKTGIAQIIGIGREVSGKRKDGSIFPIDLSVSEVMLENQTVFTGIIRDITERKNHEETLVKFKKAVNKAGHAIYITDKEGIIEYVNPAFEKITGYAAQEALGQTPRILNSRDMPSLHHKQLWDTILKGETWDSEIINRRKNGQQYHAHQTIAPFTGDQGNIKGFVAIQMDISEQYQARTELLQAKESAEVAGKAKSDFLANMSHEIRTPMNGVIGMTDLLLNTDLTKEQLRYAETVRNSGELLLGLINDILDFSKIEAGKLTLEIIDFNLQGLLEDLSATLALRAHDKGLELICSANLDVPLMLCGDPGRIRQIISNLATNAIKFTHQGEVMIRVALESESEHSTVLRFSVRDTGIGIPHDKLDLLFEKFTQADASTTRQYGGTGLGLAISKQLAELMGGSIGVISDEGRSSEFWFTACFGKQVTESVGAEPLPPAELHDVRVLIVDDNNSTREILTMNMGSWGMRPADTSNGRLALQAMQQAVTEGDPFKIAVIDMQMPGMDGETLGLAIKQDSQLKTVKMVMLTSIGQRGDARHFAEIGFDGYLTKPARQQELKNVLSVALMDRQTKPVSSLPAIVSRHSARDLLNLYTGSKARILLVEDNITNQQVAMAILGKLGLKADAVANGLEALTALETISYDLVLMDCQMPEMDGYEATRQIRNPHSAVLDHEVFIIAMTANAMQGDRDKCLAAGMNDYMTKPVKPQSLAKVLDKWLPIFFAILWTSSTIFSLLKSNS